MTTKRLPGEWLALLIGLAVLSGCRGTASPSAADTVNCDPTQAQAAGCNQIGGFGGNEVTTGVVGATIGGGGDQSPRKRVIGNFGTVGGGLDNIAGDRALVGGGSGNVSSADSATIAGGLANHATDKYSVVGGGNANVAGNGNDDLRDAQYSTVSGGSQNKAGGLAATVAGGAFNAATGAYATIPGGTSNIAAGDYSFAAGRRANVRPDHRGSFLFADSNDAPFDSSTADEFAARATGGVRFVTAIDSSGKPIAGVRLVAGSGSWETLSDRDAKTNFVSVNEQAILQRVAALPISLWNYKTQSAAIRHIGPLAQDFYATFGLGTDNRYISTVDIEGVALAAI